MYLHLGENTVVRTDSIIGIFDMDTSTISKWTKDYLSNATKNSNQCFYGITKELCCV